MAEAIFHDEKPEEVQKKQKECLVSYLSDAFDHI